ncbi:hypothetical protein [Mesorhizobium ciceri]|uniref:hypothetical protein n=1 Tax=Mesorhizobium TaxID=68287 RepID=UPI00047B638E|nr:hypothetical protein [Mesorhizobium ciceri]
MNDLTELERKYLSVCAGGIEQLPYSDRPAMARANKRLTDLGYIESGYDDDQPTSWATDAGRAAISLASGSQP